jgi:hypothetical protein
MALHRAPKYDLIGPVPKHRKGVPPRHRAINALARPAELVDAANNQPLTRVALARKAGLKAAGAGAHIGALLVLRKAADGHDAFKVSKGLSRAAHAALVSIKHGGHVGGPAQGRKPQAGVVAGNKRAEYAALRLRRHSAGKQKAIQVGQDAKKMGDALAGRIQPRNPEGRPVPRAAKKAPVGMRGPAQGRLVPAKASGRSASPQKRRMGNATILVSQDTRRVAYQAGRSDAQPARARI